MQDKLIQLISQYRETEDDTKRVEIKRQRNMMMETTNGPYITERR